MTWAPDYITLSEAKAWLRIDDTDDDVELAVAITTASRAVDTWCRRQFGTTGTAQSRTFEGVWDRSLLAYVYEVDDLADLDDLIVVDRDGNDVDDYMVYPLNAEAKGKPYERIVTSCVGPIVADGVWGWPAVPTAVKHAVRLQLGRFTVRRDSPYGIAGSPQDGSELRLLARLDPDVETSLRGYRREVWAS